MNSELTVSDLTKVVITYIDEKGQLTVVIKTLTITGAEELLTVANELSVF